MLDEQLIEQIPRLRRYAKALCGPNSAQEPDDLVQDCLERALIYQESWTPGTNLRAWLFTILHNLYVNQWRHQRRGPEVLPWSTELEKISAAPLDDGVEFAALERALSILTPDHRAVLLLVALEGMRYAEVAAILNIPEGTVMSRLARAREQLRRELHEGRVTPLRSIK